MPVDIVVDQRPMPLAPYDANTIPPAVRRRVAAIEALYKTAPDPTPAPANLPPQVPEPQASAPAAPPAPAPAPAAQATDVPPSPSNPPPATPPDSENSNTWKSRALSLQGRLEAANRDLGQVQEEYYREVMQQRRAAPQQLPPPKQFLTPEDEQNYGDDFIGVAQRAALQAVSPHLDQIKQENADLRARHARDQRRILDSQVAVVVPDYMEIDRNPAWHRWLLGIDLMSGRVRQQLLNEAISAGNAPRVASIFDGFRKSEGASGSPSIASVPSPAPKPPKEPALDLMSLAAPGRARSAAGGDSAGPPDKPSYTRGQIKTLYDQHRKGAYRGRQAEWDRIEADIFAAQWDGRIMQ